MPPSKRGYTQSTLQTSSATNSTRSTSKRAEQIYISAPIHDRSSKFIALFTTSPLYTSTPSKLQSHPSLDGAMHRILAWRARSSQSTLIQSQASLCSTFSNEDGERWAGKRVERVLIDCDVEGVAVVGRWYGGVMLGPVRFVHIEHCVREAVKLWKADNSHADAGDDEEGPPGKRARLSDPHDTEPTADETAARPRLARTLQERDTSVDVLRGLLADKTRKLAELKSAPSTHARHAVEDKQTNMPTSSPSKAEVVISRSPPKSQQQRTMDYSTLPVSRLRALEKARDATLTWILRQIESVEASIATVVEEEQRRRQRQLLDSKKHGEEKGGEDGNGGGRYEEGRVDDATLSLLQTADQTKLPDGEG